MPNSPISQPPPIKSPPIQSRTRSHPSPISSPGQLYTLLMTDILLMLRQPLIPLLEHAHLRIEHQLIVLPVVQVLQLPQHAQFVVALGRVKGHPLQELLCDGFGLLFRHLAGGAGLQDAGVLLGDPPFTGSWGLRVTGN
jgi:hypothetical protein